MVGGREGGGVMIEICKDATIGVLVYIIGLLGFRPNILVLHTLLCLYKKAVLCISLLTEYIIQNYFAHFYSLSSYSQHGIRTTFLWPSLGKIRRSSAATSSRSLSRDRKPSRSFCFPRNPHLRVAVRLTDSSIG